MIDAAVALAPSPADVPNDNALYGNLDTSWMNEYKRLENVSENCVKDPMDKIRMYILYIDCGLNIESILLETFPLSLNDLRQPVIPKDVLLKFIQDKKVKNGVKYSLFDILLYNVELESADIGVDGGGEEDGEAKILERFGGFFRSVSVIHEVVVLPSLFIFHELNSMFVLFKERDSENPKHRHTMKSILKREVLDGGAGGVGANLHSNTKKVRIVLPHEKPMKLSDKSKTRKV
jgi:hypothetical protein